MKKTIVYLFSSPTCPHCPAAKEFIQKFKETRDDFILEDLSVADDKGREKAAEFGVVNVPTFIIHGPGYPQLIGLTGNQSEKTMNKYIDLSYGVKHKSKKSGLFSKVKEMFNAK